MVNSFRKQKPGNFYGSEIIDEEEIDQAIQVLRSKSLFRYYGANVLGKTAEFEGCLAEYLKSNHALAVSSGTASLKCALKALSVEFGDEVIIPAYGFIATANAVISCGAVPKFCDVDRSLNLDPLHLSTLLSIRTKAVIVVHIMGESANLDPIVEVCKHHNVPLIEDVAQSFGATYKGRYLGTVGTIGCFSFQANKILTTGEGGAISTNDRNLFEKATIYHDQGGVRQGQDFPSWNDDRSFFGENLRMTELSAAIGIAQLNKIPSMLNHLRYLKHRLKSNLRGCSLKYRDSWDINGGCGISECFYVDSLDERDRLIDCLQSRGINAHGYYNAAVYENRLFQNGSIPKNENSYGVGICPNAELFSRQAIWLPINPLYTEEDIDYVSSVIIECTNQN